MFVPSGSAWMTSTVAPRPRSTSGATALAAPLAQSTTSRIPVRAVLPTDPATDAAQAVTWQGTSTIEPTSAPASGLAPTRSEERSVGKESVSTCRKRWWRDHEKKNKTKKTTHDDDVPTK